MYGKISIQSEAQAVSGEACAFPFYEGEGIGGSAGVGRHHEQYCRPLGLRLAYGSEVCQHVR
jgi:hypothetical protein